jgi:hypothetical protein
MFDRNEAPVSAIVMLISKLDNYIYKMEGCMIASRHNSNYGLYAPVYDLSSMWEGEIKAAQRLHAVLDYIDIMNHVPGRIDLEEHLTRYKSGDLKKMISEFVKSRDSYERFGSLGLKQGRRYSDSELVDVFIHRLQLDMNQSEHYSFSKYNEL